jgi:hypothetical protein
MVALKTVSGDTWGSRGYWKGATSSTKGAPTFVIHHSVTNPAGKNAKAQARQIEDVIYGRGGFSAVAYNWIVATDGTALVGRGWGNRNGANSPMNRYSFSAVLSGNYHPGVAGVPTLGVSSEQIETLVGIVMQGRSLGYLTDDCAIIGHRDVAGAATACPGDNAENVLQWVRIGTLVATKALEDEATAQAEAHSELEGIAAWINSVRDSGDEGVEGKDGKTYIWDGEGIVEKPSGGLAAAVAFVLAVKESGAAGIRANDGKLYIWDGEKIVERPADPAPKPKPAPKPVPKPAPKPKPVPKPAPDRLSADELGWVRRIIAWFKSLFA